MAKTLYRNRIKHSECAYLFFVFRKNSILPLQSELELTQQNTLDT